MIRGHFVLWVTVSYVLSHHGELSAAASPLLKANTCNVPGTVVAPGLCIEECARVALKLMA